MENKKFRVITEKDENGNPVRKVIPIGEAPEPECHQYGDYVSCDKDEIQVAKDEMLEDIFDVIREVAKGDRFWIVKDCAGVGEVTVGWKIDFPQMYTSHEPVVVPVKDYKGRMQDEYRQTKTRYDKLHQMCIKYEAGTLDFEPTCSLELLEEQLDAMGKYLHCLEVRAQIEGVAL